MSKKIKLLVEVDEETAKYIQGIKEFDCGDTLVNEMFEAIHNGIPITEGDLISREALKNNRPELWNPEQEGHQSYNQGWNNAISDFLDLIDNAPSIGISEENLKPTSELVKDIVGFDVSKMPKLPEYLENGNETN